MSGSGSCYNVNIALVNSILLVNIFRFMYVLCNVSLYCFVSSQEYLYGQSTKSLSYNDFVNKELVLFSNSDNERSIPCLVDGV